jgi:hypothetical protein
MRDGCADGEEVLAVLEFAGKEPAELVGVRMVGDPELELVGVRLAGPGRKSGIEVTYTVAGETYVELIPAALAVCASRANQHPRDCALPDLPD